MLSILSGSGNNSTERTLKKAGYRILARNQKGSIIINFRGKTHLSTIEAEMLVRKNKKEYVVITQAGADPTDPALLRRMVEYEKVFGACGILLVDPNAKEVEEVYLKYPRESGLDFYLQFFGALFIIGLVLAIIWLMVSVKLF